MIRPQIKVLLVDNHPLVLDGLRAILETFEHIEVVGTASLAREGLALAQLRRPDVVLMDINMPQINGIEAIEMYRDTVPDTRMLMLSMHDSREYIATSVLHGASGYVLKDVSTEEIVAAIEAVAAGDTFFSSGVSDVLMKRRPAELATPLTSREYSVLLLVASGQSNKQIAESLAISPSTVETHRKKIKKKLGLPTTAALTRYAVENGLI